ncbi:hypothetical protein Gohar_024708, partial [Gossypium harknessii]|nr:hypothetical protein [Gossypium harknessii]
NKKNINKAYENIVDPKDVHDGESDDNDDGESNNSSGYEMDLTRDLGEGCSYLGSSKGKSHEDSIARVRFFAIYDGHLGDIISSFLQKHVFSDILKEEEFWVDPFSSISKAFEKTDKTIFSQSSYLAHGGSTSLTAILINGIKLWVAN